MMPSTSHASFSDCIVDPILGRANKVLLIQAIGPLLGPSWTNSAKSSRGDLRFTSTWFDVPCDVVLSFRGDGRLAVVDVRFVLPASDAVAFANSKLAGFLQVELAKFANAAQRVVAEIKTDCRATYPASLTIHYPPFN